MNIAHSPRTFAVAGVALLLVSAGCDFGSHSGYDPYAPTVYEPAPGPSGIGQGYGGGGGGGTSQPTYVPVSVQPGCGNVPDAGLCNGEFLQFCEQGQLYTYSCPDYAMTCGYDAQYDWYDCLSGGGGGTRGGQPAAGTCTVGYEGTCTGDLLTYCQNGQQLVYDCATSGQACGWDPSGQYNNCVDAGTIVDPVDGCGGLSSAGTCSGDLLSYCQDGQIVETDCGLSGNACGLDAATGNFDCVDPGVVVDPCAGIPAEGMCVGNEVAWCDDLGLQRSVCDFGCGWDDAAGYYNCLPDPGPVDACGGIGAEGVCSGDTVEWCESGSLQSQTCTAGCGWNDAQGYYDCLPDGGGQSGDACGDVTAEGTCLDGQTAAWCESGTLQTQSCVGECGWDDANGYYACL